MKAAALVLMTFFAVLVFPPTDFAEERANPDLANVEIFELNATQQPRDEALTLFIDPATGREVSLKTLEAPQTTAPFFQGDLSPYAGSYAGGELRFKIRDKATVRSTSEEPR